MARIPLLEDREQLSGRGSKAGTLPGEQVSPLNVPKVQDTSMQSISDAVNDVADKMIKAEEIDQYNVALVNLKKGADAIKEEADTKWIGLGLEEHMEKFTERWKDLETNIDSSIKSNNVKRQLGKEVGFTRLNTQAEVRGLAHKRVHDDLIANSVETKDYFLNAAIAADSPDAVLGNLEKAYKVNENLIAAGAITQQQAALNNEQMSDKFNMGYLKRHVDNSIEMSIENPMVSPMTAFTQFSSDKPGESFNELDEDAKDELKRYSFSRGREALYARAQLQSQKDREKKEQLEENDYNAVIMFKEGKVSREQLIQSGKNREISRPMFEKLINENDNPTEIIGGPNDLVFVGDLVADIEKGPTPKLRARLKSAYINKRITRANYLTFMQRMGDGEYQNGLKILNTWNIPPQIELKIETIERKKQHAKDIMTYNYLLSGERPDAATLKIMGRSDWYDTKGEGISSEKALAIIREEHKDDLGEITYEAQEEKDKRLVKESGKLEVIRAVDDKLITPSQGVAIVKGKDKVEHEREQQVLSDRMQQRRKRATPKSEPTVTIGGEPKKKEPDLMDKIWNWQGVRP